MKIGCMKIGAQVERNTGVSPLRFASVEMTWI